MVWLNFYKAAQGKGIKADFGADLWVAEDNGNHYFVTVLAMKRKRLF